MDALSILPRRKTATVLMPCLVLLVVLALYLPRVWPVMAPGGNHGELAAAGACLGVAHPPGYPVAVQLIRAAQFAPLGSLGFRANLWASLVVALCAAVCAGWVRSFAGTGPALLAAGALALSQGVMEEGLAVEVYGLSLLLLLVMLRLLDGPAEDRRLLAASLVAGLGLAGHPTFLFGLAGAGLLLDRAKLGRLLRRLPLVAMGVLLGLSPLLALPLRSAAGVPVDWGSPGRWPLFLAHVTGLQFRQLMFRSGLEEMLWRGGSLLRFLAGSLPLPVLLLGAAGLAVHPRAFRRRLAALAVGGLVLLLYAANYRIHDITAYLLPLHLLLALAWVGPASLVPWRRAPLRSSMLMACALMLLLAAQPLDRSGRFLAYDYGTRLLERVPPRGVLITEGDLATTAVAYLTVVEGRRGDIQLHDRLGNLLRSYDDPFLHVPGGVLRREGLLLRSRPAGVVYATPPLGAPAGSFLPDGLAHRLALPGRPELPPISPVDRRPLRGLEDLPPDHELARVIGLEVLLQRMARALKDPGFADWHGLLAEARLACGGMGALRYKLGRSLAAQERHGLAVPELAAAAAELPFEPTLWNSLAWSRYRAKGDLAEALAEADRAVRLAPEVGAYHHTRGAVLMAEGRAGEAAEAFRAALAREPRSETYRADLERAERMAAGS